jgi:hypothetical protein
MMPRRDLAADERLIERSPSDWVDARLKEDRIVALFSILPDGSDVTLHFLCDPAYTPDRKAVIDTMIAALMAARMDN